MSETVVECRGCRVSYGSLLVLEDVTVRVERGQTLCLVGPNGGGKSTFLKLLLGLKEAERGEVRVLGKRPEQARRRVGYMPQAVAFDPLFPIDVEGIVKMGRLAGNRPGFYGRADRLATERALEEMELGELRRERYGRLSGGQKQRVLIARALVGEPELLLLDEPTAMVDAHTGARLLEKLKELHRRMSLVLVSHDTAFVSGLVDEVLCVNRTAVLHPLGQVEDRSLQALYGGNVRAVLHQHELGKAGALCDHD